MTLLGTWGGETPWKIYRTGKPKTEDGDGDGVIWRCTCPHGEPQGDKEANKEAGYPCKHLRSVWAHACEVGVYDPHVDWTPEGVELGKSCRCRSHEPIALRFGPPLQRPPQREGPALNQACPCGSGRKFKKCEGVGPGRPDGPPHPLLQPDRLVGLPLGGHPGPPPVTPEEQKRREKIERKAKRDEAKAQRLAAIEIALEHARQADERRRARRQELAALRKLAAELAEEARRAKDERIQRKLDEIRAKEDARREARREARKAKK